MLGTISTILHVPHTLPKQGRCGLGLLSTHPAGTGLLQSLHILPLSRYPTVGTLPSRSSGTVLLPEVVGILLACRSLADDVRRFLFILLCFLSL